MISKGLYGKKSLDIQVREHALAPAGDDRVIVKVHACGVCGTDLHFVGEWTDDHVALGHEIAAEVLEVGECVAYEYDATRDSIVFRAFHGRDSRPSALDETSRMAREAMLLDPADERGLIYGFAI